ncbi:MAG: DUF5004 domain-containing protein [Ignavibacteria bacterium]|jgi:hypothetical protein
MIKKYSLLGIILFAVAALISCSDDNGDSPTESTNPLAGVWHLQKIVLHESEEIEVVPYNALAQVIFNLNEDGSYEITTTSLVDTTTDTGSWASTETTITFDSDTEGTPNLTINYTKDGDEITATGELNFSDDPDAEPINATIILAQTAPTGVQVTLNSYEELFVGQWDMEQVDFEQNGLNVTITAQNGVLIAVASFADSKIFILTISTAEGNDVQGGLWGATSTDLIFIDDSFEVQTVPYELLENNTVAKINLPYEYGGTEYSAVWTFSKQ